MWSRLPRTNAQACVSAASLAPVCMLPAFVGCCLMSPAGFWSHGDFANMSKHVRGGGAEWTQSVVTVWNLTQACALRTRKGRVLHKPADDKVAWKKASLSGRGRGQQLGHHDFDNSRRRRAISCARSSTSSKCTKNVVNAKRLSKEAFSFQGWLWWSRLSRCSKRGVAALLTANRDHGRFVHVLWTVLRHPAIHHRRWGKHWLEDP